MRKKSEYLKLKERPAYKLNTLKKNQWLEAYKKSRSVVNSCRAVGITNHLIYWLLKKDKEFERKKNELDEMVNDVVENRAFAMTETHPVMNIFWLCNRRPERWHNVQSNVIDIKKDGELARMLLVRAKNYKVIPENPTLISGLDGKRFLTLSGNGSNP